MEKPFTDLPPRIFDLLSYYIQHYGQRESLFSYKVNGEWIKISGKEFCKRTDFLSIGLLELGIKKGDKVAFISNNCPQWNMIDFATQQIGAISVPIYQGISVSDFEYIIRHSDAKLLFLENSRLAGKYVPSVKGTIDDKSIFLFHSTDQEPSIDALIAVGEAHAERKAELQSIENSIGPDDVATIVYTSGTSGLPKGVMLTHENIMSNISHFGCRVPFIDRAVCFLPQSHILERSTQYTRIYCGISIFYAESPATIVRDIAEVKANSFSTVPRVLEKIYDSILQKGSKLEGKAKEVFNKAIELALQYDETKRNNSQAYLDELAIADSLVLKGIRDSLGGALVFITCGGTATPKKITKFFCALGIPIVEGYGLTETSPVIASNCITVEKMIKAGTIGFPLANLDVNLDSETNEILVKGPSVMKGYYKDEQLTKQSFDEEGYFHTGDKGLLDEDGFLVLTGRIKDLFKTSMGKYISPFVIEKKLCDSPWIDNAMVVGENQRFAAALIVPNFNLVKEWCDDNGIQASTNEEMVNNRQVIVRISQEVNNCNKALGDAEQIRRFKLLGNEWTIEGGELTSSLKIRRSIIAERHQKQIDELFR